VAEGLVLGVLAAVAGVGLSVWGLHALLGLAPGMLPVSEEPGLDGWVLAFSAGIAIASGAVLGIVHALPTLRTREYRGRLPGMLIGAESALAIVLLTGAGLLITTLTRLLAVDPGFARTGVLAVRIPRAPVGYDSAAAVWKVDQRILARVRAIPGVLAASSASTLPFDGGWNLAITVDGHPDLSEGAVWWRAVSPDYFKALGMTLIRGRDIAETDGVGAPGVVIINKSLADQYWPGQNPIGHLLAAGQFHGKPLSPTMDEPPREVIGVVSDTRQLGLTYENPHMMFVPQAQVPPGLVSLPAFIVRATNAGKAATAIGQAIVAVDPRMPPPTHVTIDQLVEHSVSPERFMATLMGIFAALALIVTCIGIYGVASYAVATRTRDIGIRMALGAPKQQVVALVVQQGMTPVALGLVVGLGAAWMLARLLTGMIYGVSAHDPATLALVTGVLAVSALIGTLIPARRAARIDPLVALRGD
jgi:predicted permease